MNRFILAITTGTICSVVSIVVTTNHHQAEITRLKGYNSTLTRKLHKYEMVVIQMDEQGWSPALVDKFVQEGCVPFFEVGGR